MLNVVKIPMPNKCRLSVKDYVLWPDPASRPCIASGGNFYANPEGSLCLFPGDVAPTDRTYNRWLLSLDVDACGKAFDQPIFYILVPYWCPQTYVDLVGVLAWVLRLVHSELKEMQYATNTTGSALLDRIT